MSTDTVNGDASLVETDSESDHWFYKLIHRVAAVCRCSRAYSDESSDEASELEAVSDEQGSAADTEQSAPATNVVEPRLHRRRKLVGVKTLTELQKLLEEYDLEPKFMNYIKMSRASQTDATVGTGTEDSEGSLPPPPPPPEQQQQQPPLPAAQQRQPEVDVEWIRTLVLYEASTGVHFFISRNEEETG